MELINSFVFKNYSTHKDQWSSLRHQKQDIEKLQQQILDYKNDPSETLAIAMISIKINETFYIKNTILESFIR